MEEESMTPSQQAKAVGLKSLKELSEISSASCRTLINWNRDRPQLFATVLAGAVAIKDGNSILISSDKVWSTKDENSR